MGQLRFVVILTLILLSGCTATLVNYQPSAMSNIEKALVTIERTINKNPDKRKVDLDYANERAIRLSGRVGGGMTQKTIPYRAMGNITLHTKRERFILTIYNAHGLIEHRFVFTSGVDAKQLIDALYTLKSHKPSQYSRQTTSISSGGTLKKVASRAEANQLIDENERLKKEIEKLHSNTSVSHMLEKKKVSIISSPKIEKEVKVKDLEKFNAIATQLKKLKELKDFGVLTSEEYEVKRKALVDKI